MEQEYDEKYAHILIIVTLQLLLLQWKTLLTTFSLYLLFAVWQQQQTSGISHQLFSWSLIGMYVVKGIYYFYNMHVG
ncbi:MAG: hypothetical protein ACK53Y_00050, partial [bacterium]